jgi:hypothetical protein
MLEVQHPPTYVAPFPPLLLADKFKCSSLISCLVHHQRESLVLIITTTHILNWQNPTCPSLTATQSCKIPSPNQATQPMNASTLPQHTSKMYSMLTTSFLGLMGGFSLNLRGSDRRTDDIDVAVGNNMLELKQVLSPQEL